MSIVIKNLNKYYFYRRSNQLHALKDISLRINDGDFVAIVGKSGAGKSTLLHILACIEDFQSGEYFIDDIDVKNLSDAQKSLVRNKYIGVVLQEYGLIEGYTVKENVLVPLYFAKGLTTKQKAVMVQDALEKVDIADLADCKVNKISGGQRQRVAIARAIVAKPKILLADEPTGALDEQTSAEVMDVFERLNDDKITVVVVTHDKNVASRCRMLVELLDGMICV